MVVKIQSIFFELIPDYPFIVDDENSLIQKKFIDGFQGEKLSVILYYKIRVDDSAVEGNDNTIKLSYYQEGSSTKTFIEENIRIESKKELLEISDVIIEPSQINVGSQFNFSLILENKGTVPINNVKIYIIPNRTDFIPFSSNQKILSLLKGKSKKKVTFTYFADNNIPYKSS